MTTGTALPSFRVPTPRSPRTNATAIIATTFHRWGMPSLIPEPAGSGRAAAPEEFGMTGGSDQLLGLDGCTYPLLGAPLLEALALESVLPDDPPWPSDSGCSVAWVRDHVRLVHGSNCRRCSEPHDARHADNGDPRAQLATGLLPTALKLHGALKGIIAEDREEI